MRLDEDRSDSKRNVLPIHITNNLASLIVDIGGLVHRGMLNKESNFAFGEGGAGTWSDGKLTTRIGRNSAGVRNVLTRLVEYGADPKILNYGAPHLGTDNLVRILKRMREDIRGNGGEVSQSAERSEELTTPSLVTKTTHSYSILDAPSP